MNKEGGSGLWGKVSLEPDWGISSVDSEEGHPYHEAVPSLRVASWGSGGPSYCVFCGSQGEQGDSSLFVEKPL